MNKKKRTNLDLKMIEMELTSDQLVFVDHQLELFE
jgi:hypothetical protein